MTENNEQGAGRERVVHDLLRVVKDGERLLNGADRQAGESPDAALARFMSSLGAARDSLVEVEQMVREGGREVVQASDRYARKHPWQLVGAGALAGLALGMLLGRR